MRGSQQSCLAMWSRCRIQKGEEAQSPKDIVPDIAQLLTSHCLGCLQRRCLEETQTKLQSSLQAISFRLAPPPRWILLVRHLPSPSTPQQSPLTSVKKAPSKDT